ncbi:MAG TPA: SpoIIE family protein phosphatase [Solirubrobacteraceae bacterium]|nr:SpoIIE family protein phosphatase [Solirubrobacteraceae bacterium]
MTSDPARPFPSQAMEALLRVSDAALGSLSLDELLVELLERISEILHSDTAAFLMLDEAAGVLVATAAKGIEEEVEAGVRIPLGRGFAGRIAAERRPIIIEDVDHAEIFNPILRQKGIRSLLGVPLMAEDTVLGVLHVGTLTPRRFTEGDRDLLQLAGERAALAIRHARLYDAERVARAEAQAAAARLTALQRVSDAALGSLSVDELLVELLERISEILRSDTAAFLMLDEAAGVLVATAAKGIEEEVEAGVRIPLGRGFAGRIAAERRPITIEDVDHADVLNPILRQKGIRSLLGVPLMAEDTVLGVLHVGSLTPRLFTEGDRDLLQLAAERAAVAIEHTRMFEQRRVIEAIQHTLIPPLPNVPGLELAARYLPAAVGTTIGGDWYDVFPLGRGRLALVVGDVMGHGVEAATLMAQLRTALRAYALDGNEPGSVLERMNRLLPSLSPGTMTTVAYLVLDPESESATAVSAGHIPPLVVHADGTASFAPVEGDPPLGVSRTAAYGEHRIEVPAGATLVLATDGAVEVRGESLDDGLERLRALAARRPGTETLCDAVAGGEVTQVPPADDLAILVVRLNELSDRLHTSWPADPEALAGLRHLLRRWLARRGAGPDEAYDITVAVQEASANAVEHAYAPGPAAFDVDATYDAGEVTIAVRDHGQWRPARGEHRGRGLPMMQALMDSVEVEQGGAGTTIVMRRALKRAVAA